MKNTNKNAFIRSILITYVEGNLRVIITYKQKSINNYPYVNINKGFLSNFLIFNYTYSCIFNINFCDN